MKCEACEDTGWVCENHPDRPSDCGGGTSERVCGCGAGMPFPICNDPKPGERPRLPAGFVVHKDADKGSVH